MKIILFLITFSILFLSSCEDKKDKPNDNSASAIDTVSKLDTLSYSEQLSDSLMTVFDDKSVAAKQFYVSGQRLINGQWHMRDFTFTLQSDGKIELVSYVQVSSGCLHVIGFYAECFDVGGNKIIDEIYFGDLTINQGLGERRYCRANASEKVINKFREIHTIKYWAVYWVDKSCAPHGVRCCTPDC